jgi:mannose-6-phosphate isomerase
MGKQNPEKTPWAELWMGIHNEGPSETEIAGKRLTLGELIAGNPGKFLGAACLCGNLPFLLKILAAARPLSIQAHPGLEDARRGWEEENQRGIGLSDQKRNYQDPNHKPEIICALGPFTAMAGFRETAETERLLSAFFSQKKALQDKLLKALGGGYKGLLSALFGLEAGERRAITEFSRERPAKAPSDPELSKAVALCKKLAEAYPDDSGILSPLYLNLIELRPFQAIYLPAGILHSYVYGLGVECMANSDNVLRGGLTPKHIDPKELFRIVRFEPYKPEICRGEIPEGENFCRYQTPFREFAVYRVEPRGSAVELAEKGAAIAVVIRGEASLSAGKETLFLGQGESAFIPFRDNSETLVVRGDADLFAALVPEA